MPTLEEDRKAMDAEMEKAALAERLRKIAQDGVGFVAWNAARHRWSQATFGTTAERGPVGALKHLEKEAREAYEEADAEKRKEEIIDCLFLTMDAADRAGMSLADVVRVANAKLEKNKQRTWPKPTATDVPVEHDRTGEGEPAAAPSPAPVQVKPEPVRPCPLLAAISDQDVRDLLAFADGGLRHLWVSGQISTSYYRTTTDLYTAEARRRRLLVPIPATARKRDR